jgi:DNA processing protein
MENSLFSLPTPVTPPTPEDDELSVLRLIRSRRVGPSTYYRMLAEFGTAQAALAALPEVARAAGVAGYSACPEGVALAEIRAARHAGARMVRRGQPGYPADLAEIPDAPPMLWALGDIGLLARPMVAMVGARNASSLGLRMARKLAEGLGAAGYVVVSGLARGIDAAAHAAAVPTGTVAVQAGGIDVIYPSENAALATAIAAQGLRLSEQPPGLDPQARHFPMRNRIISGLVRAVVVVEAATRSGSLITAQMALDQGRDVLAVPGHPFDARAGGCNTLIRDGAVLVRGADDILAALAAQSARPAGAGAAPVSPPLLPAASVPRTSRDPAPGTGAPADPPAPARLARTSVTALHQIILDRLGPSPVAEDQLLRDLRLSAAAVAPELLALEMEGQIQRQPGGMLARVTGH